MHVGVPQQPADPVVDRGNSVLTRPRPTAGVYGRQL